MQPSGRTVRHLLLVRSDALEQAGCGTLVSFMVDPDQTGTGPTPPDDAELESLVAACVGRLQAGEAHALEGLCTEHPEKAERLRQRMRKLHELGVVSLLAGDAASPNLDTGLGPQRTAPDEPTPERIGPFRTLEKIGEGGMGTVYLAEQSEPVRRRVAVKVIKLGMDSKQVLVRFEAERAALARMDHPNIARVLDAGITGDGRPWFAMEHVKGIPLTSYCERNKLGLESRLLLVQQLCAGVQHAHTKGVIHRDLKPGNVLVADTEGGPQPKIIDFGLARATDHGLTERTLYTEQGQMVGTPEYMSPEQAGTSALDIDSRTDVYSVGVMLYELLAGVLPFDAITLRRAGWAGIQKTICEADPPRPSTRASSITVMAKDLRGDLDWIVLKALEKDRNRRYQTPNELSAELRRYLADEPVEAMPPSAGYRLRKYVRRNKVGVTAAALVLLALIAGVIGTGWGLVQAEGALVALTEQTAETERQRDAAETVTAFLTDDLLGAVAPSAKAGRGKDVLMREVLDAASNKIESEFEDQPEVEATIRKTLGETYMELGEFAAAEPHLERALKLRRSALGGDHASTLDALYSFSVMRWQQGRFAEAESLVRDVLEGQRRVVGDEDKAIFLSLSTLAGVLHDRGRSVEAEVFARESLEGTRRVLGEDHRRTLMGYDNLAVLMVSLGRADEAEPLSRHALKQRRRLFGDGDPETLASYGNLGRLLHAMGKFTESESLMREALTGMRRVLGEDHPQTTSAIGNLAASFAMQRRFVEAESLSREALMIQRRTLGEEDARTLLSQGNLALMLRAQGRLEEAESLARQTLEAQRRVLGNRHPDTLNSIGNVGLVLWSRSQLGEAEEFLREALESRRRAQGDDHPQVARALWYMGKLCLAQGHLEEAEGLARSSLDATPADSRWHSDRQKLLDAILKAKAAKEDGE